VPSPAVKEEPPTTTAPAAPSTVPPPSSSSARKDTAPAAEAKQKSRERPMTPDEEERGPCSFAFDVNL
jgi:hypothetical protein